MFSPGPFLLPDEKLISTWNYPLLKSAQILAATAADRLAQKSRYNPKPLTTYHFKSDVVKNKPYFNEYGIPQNKRKSTGSNKEDKDTIPNANYLWINLFATSLNESGRAALVMPNSASNARHSEQEIRIRLPENGLISQMTSLPSRG